MRSATLSPGPARCWAWLETRFNQPATGRRAGAAPLGRWRFLIVITATVAGAIVLHLAGVAVLVLVCNATLPAQRSLHDHVRAVAIALETGGVDAARQAVAKIVGRNPAFLDAPAVARAAIESLAENFSDGVVAPALWISIAGLPGGAALQGRQHRGFDDWTPDRTLCRVRLGCRTSGRPGQPAGLPVLRAFADLRLRQSLDASPRGAIQAVWRDAGRHRSPNAGWPEAAMAGALGLSLAGPRVYGDTRIDDAFMGNGRRDATVPRTSPVRCASTKPHASHNGCCSASSRYCEKPVHDRCPPSR